MKTPAEVALTERPAEKEWIKLSMRRVFDSDAQGEFERNVWEESFHEFLVQVQSFDPEQRFKTWSELTTHIPKAKINVTYKTSFAIGLLVQALNKIVPHVNDNLERTVIPFDNWAFEIVESDVRDKQQHRVAITYETGELELKAMIGDFMVIAFPGFDRDETITIRMNTGISISSHRGVRLALRERLNFTLRQS